MPEVSEVEVKRAQQFADTALDRAQLYVTKLIAASNIEEEALKKTRALAQELWQLTLATNHRRVTSSDVLAIACGARATIKVRVIDWIQWGVRREAEPREYGCRSSLGCS